ncbi:hypothetical protein [Microbacterium sp. K41]|uniref:hypothetical protein n=1 Tax=Microbacterium sp. K41 TaxID=2305437 RepID=UPI00109D08A9|nr:hypothetical protein [Microbacterium sp. K41]
MGAGASGGAPVLALLAGLSAAYLGVAAVLALYVLPVGFGLTALPLVLAQAGVILGGGALVAVAAVRILAHRRRRERLIATARALGWDYRADVGDRLWGGSVDEQIERGNRTATDLIDARESAVPFDSVERTFVVGDGEGSTLHTVRAVRIPLPSEAPRLTLRSRRGGGALSVLPQRARRGSVLTLEGDFSDVFEVSVPAGYETDALYVLTPDLMAVLLDESPHLDLEIVDSTLHVYFPARDLTQPAELSRFLTTIAVLHDRFGRRTFLYRDDAAPAIDAATYRRAGDRLSAAARGVETRTRWWPVVAAVLTPLVPLLIAALWTSLAG